jgi:hypothetical protein
MDLAGRWERRGARGKQVKMARIVKKMARAGVEGSGKRKYLSVKLNF